MGVVRTKQMESVRCPYDLCGLISKASGVLCADCFGNDAVSQCPEEAPCSLTGTLTGCRAPLLSSQSLSPISPSPSSLHRCAVCACPAISHTHGPTLLTYHDTGAWARRRLAGGRALYRCEGEYEWGDRHDAACLLIVTTGRNRSCAENS